MEMHTLNNRSTYKTVRVIGTKYDAPPETNGLPNL
jgi:hypothetical protein